MAITVTVNSVDITSYVPLRGHMAYRLQGLQIEEDAIGLIAQCTFGIIDPDHTVDVQCKHEVAITDGGTTLFGGEVAYVDKWQIANVRVILVRCQDYNILLEETIIPIDDDGNIILYSASADSYIIGNAVDGLFPQFLSDIDSSTYVDTIDASMDDIDFPPQTMREAMSHICERTGGRFYVDFDKNLHYFDGSEGDAASFNLSDDPDFSATYPYGNFRRAEDGTVIVDRVYITGEGFVSWVGAGDREYLLEDLSDDTLDGLQDKANAIIAQYENPQVSYELVCWEDGLRAGEDIDVTNATWGLSAETLTIRRITMTCISEDGTDREYRLQLGDPYYGGEQASRARGDISPDGGLLRHALLSAAHYDADPNDPTRGDLIVANDTPEWTVLGIGTSGYFLKSDGSDPAWAAITLGDVGGIAYGTPALTLSTANAAGSAETVMRTDATIAAFDATNPTTIAVGGSAGTGSAGKAARRDHAHGVTTSSNPGGAAAILATAADGGIQLARLGVGTDADTDDAIKMVKTGWIGMGAAMGRIVFAGDDSDQIHILGAIGVCIGGEDVSDTELRLIEAADSCRMNLDTYSAGADYSFIRFRKSDSDTAGTASQTDDGDILGGLYFYGVDSGANPDYGASIVVDQSGAAGTRVPARLLLTTFSSTAQNTGICLDPDGDLGVGIVASIGAQLHVDQASASGAQPVLYLDQADVSEEFVRFKGSAATGVLTQSIVDEGDQASETREGWLKVYVVDDGNQITDQAYYVPIYSLSA